MKKKKMFEKVLIANRGEIAVRVIKTLRKMGIKSVAVYSETDTNAMHVNMADEAIFIGNSPATDSYLVIDHIIDAVRKSCAQAVHPGYGFLSENPLFAKALNREKVELIGPSAEIISKMGDKIEAKKIAEKAGVNTVPGYMGVIEDEKKAVKIAKKIGFPVIVKAAAGGGGKGMRVVENEDDMHDAFVSASNEARNNFNDDRLFIEKYIQRPRHIEIQVLADKYGNAVCIGERECSIQRHHQKVLEEAPSPFISEKTRALMYKQALKLVKAIDYFSVGTVEFIVDKNQKFYFMEMNTRLQVEHCVTELVYDIDLVEQMVKVAAGEELQLNQSELNANGWAIEARICAEDPSRGFLPSSGRITRYEEPLKNSQIRVDTGVSEGGEVSMFYDQMIAKLCSHAPTRIKAIEVLKTALGEYVISGILHNISFLQAILDHKKFIDGDISTKFIDDEYPDGFLGAELTSEITQIFIAATVFLHMKESIRAADIEGDHEQVRKVGTRWVINIDGVLYLVIVKEVAGGYNIRYERNRINIRSNWTLGSKLLRGFVNGTEVAVLISSVLNGYRLKYAARKVTTSVKSPRVAELERFMIQKETSESQKELKSPITGKVVKIFVKPDEEITEGQKLMVIEAMKMENLIVAKKNNKIAAINVKDGDVVNTDDVLMEFAT